MKESLQIDIREGDKKWIFIPPSLSKKKHISTLQFANFLIINFNTVAPRVIYTHSNESTRNHLCLFLSFFSLSLFYALHEFSIEYQSVGKTIISVHRSRRQKPCAFWNGIPSPSPSMPFNFRFLFPPPPKKTTLSFRPQGNKLFQVIIVVVVVASSFHSIRGTRK